MALAAMERSMEVIDVAVGFSPLSVPPTQCYPLCVPSFSVLYESAILIMIPPLPVTRYSIDHYS